MSQKQGVGGGCYFGGGLVGATPVVAGEKTWRIGMENHLLWPPRRIYGIATKVDYQKLGAVGRFRRKYSHLLKTFLHP